MNSGGGGSYSLCLQSLLDIAVRETLDMMIDGGD